MAMPMAHYLKYTAVLILFILLLAGCEQTRIEPIPQFLVNPSEGTVPLKVRFEDTSIPGNTPIQSWWWDFGDGGTGTGRIPEHTYREPGAYDVALVLTTSEGTFSLVKEEAVIVHRSGTFGEPDETNRFSGEGVTIQLPEDYDADIVFGVKRDIETVSLDAYAPLQVLSDTFTVLHNQTVPDLFLYDSGGLVMPATLSIDLLDPLPPGIDVLNLAQLLVRLEDGRIVPVPGTVVNNTFTASVLRLPQRADYVVVLRDNITVTDVRGESTLYEERLADSDADPWADFFTLYACGITEQIVTALYRGSMSDENSFLRRNYSVGAVDQAMFLLAEYVQEALNDLAAAGLRAPTLIAEDNGYTLSLFKMHPAYGYDIKRVSDLIYFDTFFGHLVVDPAQLLAVTIRNLRIAAADADARDFTSRFFPQSACAEALMNTVFPSYAIPVIATTGNTALGLPVPADRDPGGAVKAVPFYQGFEDGATLYFGRRSVNYKARGFGDNEHGILSLPALFPYDAFVPGYSFSGHEFLAWLDETESLDDPLFILAHVMENLHEELEALAVRYTRALTFNEALFALYMALDHAFQEDESGVFSNLADYYWEFFKDYAYLNGEDTILRPSDSLRAPFSFNEDRFAYDAIIPVVFDEPIALRDLTSDNEPKLKNIAPMTTRAIVLDLHPMTTEVEVTIDGGICDLEHGYIPRIAVYQDGQPGVEFEDAPGDVPGYSLIDTTGDGRTDTIRAWQQGCEGVPCSNRVIVLVANLQYEYACDLSLDISTFTNLDRSETEVLERYVTAYEPLYDYSLERVFDYGTREGYTAYLFNMTSGAWRGAHEVYAPLWQHELVIIEPNNINQSTGMLFVSGGSRSLKNVPGNELRDIAELGELAKASRSAITLLTLVPNQPLLFTGETRLRSEDAIIAYSFDQYIQNLDLGAPDQTWPALLPMTRAAVRAMDTVQHFMFNRPGKVRVIDKFVVAGASKRGWTTWLTAAVDDRVSAIIPMVIDVLNMPEQMEHHRRAYATYPFNDSGNAIFNGYSTAIRDYVEFDVFGRFGDGSGESLLRIVDPYRYRDVLTMPKFIANSTGDQFFLPDSSKFYLDEMDGANYLNYAPNTDHGLNDGFDIDSDTLSSIRAFYIAQVYGAAMPTYEWAYNPVTTEITVTTSEPPLEVNFWFANAPVHRDFRLRTLGPAWQSREVLESGDGAYRDTIGAPASGWRGGFMQMRFAGPTADTDYVFSTPVWVTPDTYSP